MCTALAFREAIFILFILFIASGEAANNGVEDEQILKRKLQEVLPQHFPPYDMLNNTVYIYNDLLQIVDVDEKQGLWEIKLWIFLSYRSDQAKDAWEGNESLPQTMLFPQGTFWTPDISMNVSVLKAYFKFYSQITQLTTQV